MLRKKSIIILAIIIFVLFCLIAIGAAIYQAIEVDINYRDSLFIMVMAATTIGITENHPQTTSGIWFFMFYSLLMVTYFLGSFFIVFDLTYFENKS